MTFIDSFWKDSNVLPQKMFDMELFSATDIRNQLSTRAIRSCEAFHYRVSQIIVQLHGHLLQIVETVNDNGFFSGLNDLVFEYYTAFVSGKLFSGPLTGKSTKATYEAKKKKKQKKKK